MIRVTPNSSKPELYDDIFKATVLEVKPGIGIVMSGAGPPHMLTVEITETIKGDKSGVVQLNTIFGCGLFPPEVGDSSTFFIEGDRVIPGRYSSDLKARRRNPFSKETPDG